MAAPSEPDLNPLLYAIEALADLAKLAQDPVLPLLDLLHVTWMKRSATKAVRRETKPIPTTIIVIASTRPVSVSGEISP